MRPVAKRHLDPLGIGAKMKNIVTRHSARRKVIAILADSYPGDEAWSEFARAYGALDDSVESVATARLGHDCRRWLESPVPYLEGLSPRQVMAGWPEGERAVRDLIMRMP